MRVTVALEIGGRTVVEQHVTTEDFRGDYRNAVQECASRVELSTFGPNQSESPSFDPPLQMRFQA